MMWDESLELRALTQWSYDKIYEWWELRALTLIMLWDERWELRALTQWSYEMIAFSLERWLNEAMKGEIRDETLELWLNEAMWL